MTVPTTARRAGPFNGNGVATSFPFTFKVFTSADVQVVKTSTAGVDTTLVLDTDYAVTLNPDQDATPGGTITYPVSGTPLAAGEKLSAVGATDYDQQLDLSGGGKFDPTVIENALDRQVFQIQQLAEKIDRTLLVSVATPTAVDTTLPAPESNKLIGWNAAGDGLQNMDPTTLATIVAFGTAIPDIFTGDGVTTAFTLTANPAALGNLDVAVGGVTQLPGVDYFWASGTSLTFASAPANGVKILVRYIQALPQGATDSAASVYQNTLAGSVSRTVKAALLESVSLLDFGAVGDGAIGALSGTGTGTNDYAVIQAGLDAITSRAKPTRVIVPFGYVFRLDSKLKVNATYVTLDFQGGALDFFNVTGKAVQVYATGSNPYRAQPWAIGHGKICGPAYSVVGSVGVFYESNSGGVGTTDIQNTFAQGIIIWGFETSIKVGNNAYLNNHIEVKCWFSKYWFDCPSGLTNTGQRWTFLNCSLLNGINGISIAEPTIHVDLISCTGVPTGGYMFKPEAGFITAIGGGVEVDSSTGSQMIYNTNAGAGAKCGVDIHGMEVLFKNKISKSPIEINSTNCYVSITGKKWSVADAVSPGTIPLVTGTGSGTVWLDALFDDAVTQDTPASTAGAGIFIGYRNRFTGAIKTTSSATFAGLTSTAGLTSQVTPGGSVFALSGANTNQVTINATPTVLVANNVNTYIWLVRDQTSGGAAFGIYDNNGGLVVLSNTIAATVAFTATASGLKAATTAGTVTRVMIVMAIRV